MNNIFFDLDGTLTDPREGIINSIRHALLGLGHEPPPERELEYYIGPPLRDGFATLLQTRDAAIIDQAIRLYREHFTETGMYENIPYLGMDGLLARLNSAGRALYVVTSKPAVFAVQIGRHFALDRYFKTIYGSELDGRLAAKTELIAHVLRTEGIAAEDTVMIGDREHDIKGARANGVRSLGVLWGYGSLEELERAGPDAICRNLSELEAALAEP